MAPASALADLGAIPRLGWVSAATPVTSLPELAARLGLGFVGIKRDDAIPELHGGTKVRKLDYLLAAPPFRDAERWVTIGGIGSGNAVALTAAAERLGRRVDAHLFWTPISPSVVDNLAYVASGPATISYHRSRAAMALSRPQLFLRDAIGGAPVLPPGSSSGPGMVGLVHAGLELAEQIRAGELPRPDRIYLAFGSGGTAVGLSVGLAMAGVKTEIVAVTVVERLLSTRARVRALDAEARRELARHGLADLPGSVPIRLERGQLGLGYAAPSAASEAACAEGKASGLWLEPVYTGKALAALLADEVVAKNESVLFWNTARTEELPHGDDFMSRLPPALARRLKAPPATGRRIARRRVLAAVAAVSATVAVARVTGYASIPWEGRVLAVWEAQVFVAAAEVFVPMITTEERASLAARIDRYLLGMPAPVLRDVHRMLALIEHGITPLGGELHRFTNVPAPAREAYLSRLEARGGLLALAARSLRDLCMLGYYQQPSTWTELGYGGPMVSLEYDPRSPMRVPYPRYDALVAPPGAQPKGLVP